MDTQTQLTLTDNYGQKFKITSPTTQIGSAPQSNIVLDEPGVLNTHAEIRFENNLWILHDTSGENSVSVNGEKIQTPHQLNNNDVISIGGVILRVALENLQSTPTPAFNTTPSQNITADLSGFRSGGDSSAMVSQATQNQSVVKKPCRACHQLIHPEAEICPHCGVRQMEPPPSTPKVGKKSRTTAALLAIFLGGLGAHKFYLGQTGLGFAYLIFCWTYIPSISGLIEGISYLGMNDQQFAAKYG